MSEAADLGRADAERLIATGMPIPAGGRYEVGSPEYRAWSNEYFRVRSQHFLAWKADIRQRNPEADLTPLSPLGVIKANPGMDIVYPFGHGWRSAEPSAET